MTAQVQSAVEERCAPVQMIGLGIFDEARATSSLQQTPEHDRPRALTVRTDKVCLLVLSL